MYMRGGWRAQVYVIEVPSSAYVWPDIGYTTSIGTHDPALSFPKLSSRATDILNL